MLLKFGYQSGVLCTNGDNEDSIFNMAHATYNLSPTGSQ